MRYDVSKLNPKYHFYVEGVSYIGKPRDNTVMYVTAKVQNLTSELAGHRNCLVFAEKGMERDRALETDNLFLYSDNPKREYADFVIHLAEDISKWERQKHYTLVSGYYVGEDVQIGTGAYIEPGCHIGHGVVIGKNAVIKANAVVKNATIGDNVVINESAVVGASGFTMAEDENGDQFRIPTMGKVIIGDHVEIGALDNISCGSAGDTVIEDHVKLDALIYIGHDVYIERNAVLTAGAIIGGFARIGGNGYVGINAAVKNRQTLGERCLIGMGSVVIRDVHENETVVGNPAQKLR